MGGAETLWQNDMMGGRGGYRQPGGRRLDAEAGFGTRLSGRLVGTPHAGMRTSEFGRYYRAGYKIGLTGREALQLELGAELQQHESNWGGHGIAYPEAASNRRLLAHGNIRW